MSTVSPRQPDSMRKSDIVGKSKKIEVQHFDGNKRTVYVTNVETPFPRGEKIVSLSDKNGIIVNANSTFANMSGYSRSELLGVPHYVLNHPDMPKSIFKEMWQSLKKHDEWSGVVKNLRKDGGYYWVFAKVSMLSRNGEFIGYTSTRFEPTPQQRMDAEKKYEHLLLQEK